MFQEYCFAIAEREWKNEMERVEIMAHKQHGERERQIQSEENFPNPNPNPKKMKSNIIIKGNLIFVWSHSKRITRSLYVALCIRISSHTLNRTLNRERDRERARTETAIRILHYIIREHAKVNIDTRFTMRDDQIATAQIHFVKQTMGTKSGVEVNEMFVEQWKMERERGEKELRAFYEIDSFGA